jgi:hypothetical protein
MAQPATSPKIEELRFRIKTDPKSRLFYPLAEELRKVGQSGEAEQVLRTGLAHHPTYLSAWVSLGRVLRDQKNDGAAIEPLAKALQLDPGNVVAARLLADAYLATGEKLEAIKKYKLVHALMPGDEDLNAMIARLERELNPPAPAPVSAFEMETPAEPDAAPEPAASPFAPEHVEEELSPWAEEQRVEVATGDAEPMLAAHDESPFEEPVAAFTSAAVEIEDAQGVHLARAPLAAEVPVELPAVEELPPVDAAPIDPEAASVADVFAPAAEAGVAEVGVAAAEVDEPFAIPAAPEAAEPPEDFTNTITMADLYARQGLVADARMIYENILLRDPANDGVRAKLAALDAPAATAGRDPRVVRLEAWLAKVGRREASRV